MMLAAIQPEVVYWIRPTGCSPLGDEVPGRTVPLVWMLVDVRRFGVLLEMMESTKAECCYW